jgi:hypothetical protein
MRGVMQGYLQRMESLFTDELMNKHDAKKLSNSHYQYYKSVYYKAVDYYNSTFNMNYEAIDVDQRQQDILNQE